MRRCRGPLQLVDPRGWLDAHRDVGDLQVWGKKLKKSSTYVETPSPSPTSLPHLHVLWVSPTCVIHLPKITAAAHAVIKIIR